jgi:hypothetical protein
VNELLDRKEQLQPLLRAARDRAATIVNPFRCKAIHKKAIFAVLTDDELQSLFTERSARPSPRTSPGRGGCATTTPSATGSGSTCPRSSAATGPSCA